MNEVIDKDDPFADFKDIDYAISIYVFCNMKNSRDIYIYGPALDWLNDVNDYRWYSEDLYIPYVWDNKKGWQKRKRDHSIISDNLKEDDDYYFRLINIGWTYIRASTKDEEEEKMPFDVFITQYPINTYTRDIYFINERTEDEE